MKISEPSLRQAPPTCPARRTVRGQAYSKPKFGMETLSIHEAAPGHHFQLSIQQEIKIREWIAAQK